MNATPMKSPKTGGEFFRLLVRRYGTNQIPDLVTLSGINYGTIQNWQEHPSARIRRGGKTHYRRLFLEKPGNVSEDREKPGNSPGVSPPPSAATGEKLDAILEEARRTNILLASLVQVVERWLVNNE